MYKLTISKVLDRKGLANALQHISNLSLRGRLNIVDNLPFIDEDIWYEESYVSNVLSPYCEFSYEETSPNNGNIMVPPWEKAEYISARNWYNTLPKEDQEKIDILVQGNIAWG